MHRIILLNYDVRLGSCAAGFYETFVAKYDSKVAIFVNYYYNNAECC